MAITGIEYFRLRPGTEGQYVYGVLVTTMTKLYQFQGSLNAAIGNRTEERPLLLPLFYAYLNTKGEKKDEVTQTLLCHLVYDMQKSILKYPAIIPFHDYESATTKTNQYRQRG